ncbi:MAG: plasma-membrane proton-efflux P-type ATPase [Acidobacteriota bacterium]|nr:plasma-membrane proton-efflux P-type ATPase [Acidobacteriota bacterium]
MPPPVESTGPSPGLSSQDAAARLLQYGPNAVTEAKPHPLLAFVGRFWAPVPWMLEATVVLELLLGRRFEAGIIGLLLLFNVALSLIQEGRANRALQRLRARLSLHARVRRDGEWREVPTEALVPGDFVHLRLGDIVPADVTLRDGAILLDQSMLTGESVAADAGPGALARAGAVVKRGEASGEVTATGDRTVFGRTAQLVGHATRASHLSALIFTIVRYMLALDGALVVVLLVYAAATKLPFADVLPFALILLVASVPAALPATFTLATALGSLELARRGVLTTRLSAIEDAAGMDVLCTDKTGTLTQNRLAVAALQPCPPYSEIDLLRLAAWASDAATQDPIDLAVLTAARDRGVPAAPPSPRTLIPFDPATKTAESIVADDGPGQHIVKGAPQAVARRLAAVPATLAADVERLASTGSRVLAVAEGRGERLALAGLVALQDPPRPDSAQTIGALRALGVRVIMITGDGLATARAVAARVGLGNRATAQRFEDPGRATGDALQYDVRAEALPEDKFTLIRALQREGHLVGMTGDGVNDAPALRQAEVGIAVASATDVAKSAASLVLTNPGLSDMIAAVETSRRVYQRMVTYTLNKIIKTVEIGFFLTIGVVLAHALIITPPLIVLLLFTNDFATMAIATDRVSFSPRPDHWHVGTLTRVGLALGACVLGLSLGIFAWGRWQLHLPLAQLRTLVFVTLVFTGQGMIYLVRERSHFWHSAPGRWLLLVSLADIGLVSLLAVTGTLMAALPPYVIVTVAAAGAGYLAAIDALKVVLLRRSKGAPLSPEHSTPHGG